MMWTERSLLAGGIVLFLMGLPVNSFNTLTWRTYRYIQVKIKTKDEPLVIDDIYGTFTGYPFKLNAKLETPTPKCKKCWILAGAPPAFVQAKPIPTARIMSNYNTWAIPASRHWCPFITVATTGWCAMPLTRWTIRVWPKGLH
jgi:hypothetical protein